MTVPRSGGVLSAQQHARRFLVCLNCSPVIWRLPAVIFFGSLGHYFEVFAFRPNSRSRRRATDRLGSCCFAAQWSTCAMNSSVRRTVRVGAAPVTGRPRLLGIAFFTDLVIVNAIR
jgi:hypothetical protein